MGLILGLLLSTVAVIPSESSDSQFSAQHHQLTFSIDQDDQHERVIARSSGDRIVLSGPSRLFKNLKGGATRFVLTGAFQRAVAKEYGRGFWAQFPEIGDFIYLPENADAPHFDPDVTGPLKIFDSFLPDRQELHTFLEGPPPDQSIKLSVFIELAVGSEALKDFRTRGNRRPEHTDASKPISKSSKSTQKTGPFSLSEQSLRAGRACANALCFVGRHRTETVVAAVAGVIGFLSIRAFMLKGEENAPDLRAFAVPRLTRSGNVFSISVVRPLTTTPADKLQQELEPLLANMAKSDCYKAGFLECGLSKPTDSYTETFRRAKYLFLTAEVSGTDKSLEPLFVEQGRDFAHVLQTPIAIQNAVYEAEQTVVKKCESRTGSNCILVFSWVYTNADSVFFEAISRPRSGKQQTSQVD